jgi:hypothetical protein
MLQDRSSRALARQEPYQISLIGVHAARIFGIEVGLKRVVWAELIFARGAARGSGRRYGGHFSADI